MHKSQIAVSTLTIALLALAVGCADGKKGGGKLNRKLPSSTAKPTDGRDKILNEGDRANKDKGPLDNKTGGDKSGDDKPGKPSVPVTADAAVVGKIENLRKEQTATATKINLNEVAQGKYLLDSVAVDNKLIAQKADQWVHAFKSQKVAISGRDASLNDQVHEVAGLNANQTDIYGFDVAVPVNFEVAQQGAFEPKRVTNSLSFKTQLVRQSTKVELQTGLEKATDAQLHLMDVLSGQANKDNQGRAVSVNILKTAEGQLRFHLVVEEKFGKETFSRHIYLTFKNSAAEATKTSTFDQDNGIQSI